MAASYGTAQYPIALGQDTLTPDSGAASLLNSTLFAGFQKEKDANEVSTPKKILKCIERAAMQRTGAVPLFTVETGKEEVQTVSAKQQKRAWLLVKRLHAESDVALSMTRTVLESCEAAGVDPPRTPEMESRLRTMFSFLQDTVVEVDSQQNALHIAGSDEDASNDRATVLPNNTD